MRHDQNTRDAALADALRALENLRSTGRKSEIVKVWCDDAVDCVRVLADTVEDLEAELDAAKVVLAKARSLDTGRLAVRVDRAEARATELAEENERLREQLRRSDERAE